MKKTYASEFFFYQEPISKRCEFSLQVHSKILVKQPMHASGLKTSSSDESLSYFKGGRLVTVRPDGFLFSIAEIACGDAFKLFTEL